MKKGKQTVRLRPPPLPVLAGALAPISPRLGPHVEVSFC